MINKGFNQKNNLTNKKKLPPGQYLVDYLLILTAGPTPKIDLELWNLEIYANQDLIKSFTWQKFLKLPQSEFFTDIHCVTKWSLFDTVWEGVYLEEILEQSGINFSSGYIYVSCYGGYKTNIPMSDINNKKAMIAHSYNSKPLEPPHGGPARLIVPHLYFWKSAKLIKSIHIIDKDKPGFWESYGYHMYGDPWKEQRYYND